MGATTAPYTKRQKLADRSLDKLPLRAFHAALADASANPCDILAIGTSITEGSNNTVRANRWVNVLTDLLRTEFPSGATGGEGYVPAFYRDANIVGFAEAGGAVAHTGFGLADRAGELDAGETLSITVTATDIDVYWTGSAATGAFSWAVDGGVATNVNTVLGALEDMHVTSIAGLAAASHALVLTGVSGKSYIDGIMVFNGDKTKGIHMWEAGWGSGMASNYTATAPLARLDRHLDVIGPDLVLICHGINEWFFGTAPATFRTNVETLVSHIRAHTNPDASICLVVDYTRSSAGFTPVASWQSYVDALYAAAVADGNLSLCDMTARYGDNAGAVALGIIHSDNLHLTTKGSRFFARALADHLLP